MFLEIALFLVAILFIYNLCIYLEHIYRLQFYPPGPFPLPIIGNLLVMMKEKPYDLVFTKMAQKYGNVFSLSFGMQRMVIVQTIEAAREALVVKATDFAGRDNNHPGLRLISRNWKGIAFVDYGKEWKHARKLGHAGLKTFGDAMEKLDVRITKECDALHERIDAFDEKPIEFKQEIELTVLNILCSILFGKRYDFDDPEFKTVVEMTSLTLDGLADDPVAIFTWLQYLPNKSLRALNKCLSLRDPYLRKKLNEHKQISNKQQKVGLIDSLIQLQKDSQATTNSVDNEVTDDQIEMIISDLLIVGAQTGVLTMRWIILYMVHFPECQQEAYEEIKALITDTNRKPELKDRHSLSYVQAFILEAMRFSSAAPLGIPHKATKDSSIGGQCVPQNAQVLFNIWNIHYDERHWDKPREFNPARWLDENRKYIPGSNTSFLAFSAGRRVCIGEALAKTELFIMVVRMLNDYSIEANPDEQFPKLEPKNEVTLQPYPFKVVFKKRIHNEL